LQAGAHENISLAHCEPNTLVVSPDVEQLQIQDTTPKSQDVIASVRTNMSVAEFGELEEPSTVWRYLCYEEQ
jgi:hypothetical protein